jgi:hypothetical protein
VLPQGEIAMRGSTGFKAAIGMLVIVSLTHGGTALGACEREAAQLCSSGDPRCLEGAAQSVEQAMADCKTPEGRQQNAALWQATPTFFDGEPYEHRFWRCVAHVCDERN